MTEQAPSPPWQALRRATGLSQRAVERALGWTSGHLSWIERGARPKPEQEEQLRRFYADALLKAQEPSGD